MSTAEREVRALPVVVVSLVMVTIALVVWTGRGRSTVATPPPDAGMPSALDVDHFVAGSPAAVAEAFLRAWMRADYAAAAALATGAMKARADRETAETLAFSADQRALLVETRAYTAATHYDLDHVEVRELPNAPGGAQRREVRGVAHARGNFQGRVVETHRAQTFTLEQVEGAWKVSERTWERDP